MPSFPPSALPSPTPPTPPGAETPVVARWLGSMPLNDRINTFYRRHDIGSAAVTQIEQLANRDGQAVVTKVDHKAPQIVLYVLFRDTAELRYEDWQPLIEDNQGVRLTLGDGTGYPQVHVEDCTAQQKLLIGFTADGRVLRWWEASIKVVALTRHRVPM